MPKERRSKNLKLETHYINKQNFTISFLSLNLFLISLLLFFFLSLNQTPNKTHRHPILIACSPLSFTFSSLPLFGPPSIALLSFISFLLSKNLAHTNLMAVEAQYYHLISPQTYKNRYLSCPLV